MTIWVVGGEKGSSEEELTQIVVLLRCGFRRDCVKQNTSVDSCTVTSTADFSILVSAKSALPLVHPESFLLSFG